MARLWLLVPMTVALLAPAALAATAEDPFQAVLTMAQNKVEWQRAATRSWQKALIDTVLLGGDTLRTGQASKAELVYGDGSVTRVGGLTTLTLTGDKRREIRLDGGTVLLNIRKGGAGMRVITPGAVAAVTGTELMVEFDPARKTTEVTVFEGAVNVTGDVGDLVKVMAGTTTRVLPNAPAPVPVPLDNTKLRERDNLFRTLSTPETHGSSAPDATASTAPDHGGAPSAAPVGTSPSSAPTTPVGAAAPSSDPTNPPVNDIRFQGGSPTTGSVRVIIK